MTLDQINEAIAKTQALLDQLQAAKKEHTPADNYFFNGRYHNCTLQQAKINDRFYMYNYNGVFRLIELPEHCKITLSRNSDILSAYLNVLDETTGKVFGVHKLKPICFHEHNDRPTF